MSTASNGFPVVGIGASAGGLEAFIELLGGLPPDSGIAFVLVQHLEPHHASQLTDILSRVTPMPVVQAEDGLRVEANRVYVIAPNTKLTIEQGVLHSTPSFEGVNPNLPIDHFFQSLAEDQGRRAIGVVLSGSASDGSQGIRAIKSREGVTFAQDEGSAKYASMPQS